MTTRPRLHVATAIMPPERRRPRACVGMAPAPCTCRILLPMLLARASAIAGVEMRKDDALRTPRAGA